MYIVLTLFWFGLVVRNACGYGGWSAMGKCSNRCETCFLLNVTDGCIPLTTPWIRPFISRNLKKMFVQLNVEERML